MKKFRSTFEMEIDVHFTDPDKAHAYFIEGDWKDSFYRFPDLKKVVEQLSYAFHEEPEQWQKNPGKWGKFVEGYGLFVRQDDCSWHLEEEYAKDSGGIVIKYEMELEGAGTFEVSE